MNRDGANISFWQKVPVYTDKNSTLPGRVMDVAIVGGGITGLATAYQLQKKGKECILIESYNIGFGTTGGTTAHINTLLEASYAQVEQKFNEETSKLLYNAALNALNTISVNVRELNIDCGFEYKDAYMFSKNKKQSEELDEIIKASQKAGLKIEYANHNPIPVPFDKIAVISDQAQFHPLKYIAGLAGGFEDAGGTLLQNCKMESFEDDTVVTLKTTKGEIKARKVIFATHIPPGINLLHFRCAPYRSYVIAVRLQDNSYPDSLIYDMDDPYRYYRSQEENGQKYLLMGGEDHKTGHGENTELPFERLREYLEKYFKVQEISYKWSSQFYESSDGLAYIGLLPGHGENVFVATGFGGDGMPYSHISANLLTDLIINGDSIYKKVFDPKRVKPVAAFAKFLKENSDVVKEFVAKRISIEKIENTDELREGQGRVIKLEGDTIALSRNDSSLFAVDPVCKHAKCIVVWNQTERSWDCPCHGARYDPHGEVLNGPTTIDLDKVDF